MPHCPRPTLAARWRPTLAPALGLALALGLVLLMAGCGGGPKAPGELRYVQDDAHRIADPGVIGASATGTGCGITRGEALTMARRVAQFNLRSLTGQARYNVRFDLVSETPTAQGVCVELSALALEPRPYER